MQTMTGQDGTEKGLPSGPILTGILLDLFVCLPPATSAQMAKNMIKVHKDVIKLESLSIH
jgi:hypothetical protein